MSTNQLICYSYEQALIGSLRRIGYLSEGGNNVRCNSTVFYYRN